MSLNPELDVATYLTGIGGLSLAFPSGVPPTGGNLFTGAVLPANIDGKEGGVPAKAVFVQSVGGPPPMPYFGPAASAGSFYYHGVQVSVRSNPDQQADGLVLARGIRDALHKATIPISGGGSYTMCLVKESQPLYIGADAANRHRWTINLDLRSATTP